MNKLVPIIAILAIAALEAYAIHQGINGTALAGALVAIAGIGGYTARRPKKKG